MSIKRIGYALIVIGAFGVIGSIMVDRFGLGKPGIQAAQLLGILLGVILAFVGLGFINTYRTEKFNLLNRARAICDYFLNLPSIVWVIVGFLLVYVMLFIFPVFFNSEHRILYFNRYIPDAAPIGLDLNTIVVFLRTWLTSNQSPYPTLFYPPLHHVLLAPLVLLDYPQSYYFVTMLTLASFFVLSLLIPLLVNKNREYSIPIFFFVTSLFSYGLQFELERGQFNVITFTLCMIAIYLFYFHNSFRHLAYLLFSFSVQLRIYPAIFIIMFVSNWATWKQNIKRLFWIGILNLALLFVLGYTMFIDFIRSVSGKLDASWTWIGNHSITAFVYNLTNSNLGLFAPNTLNWLKEHSTFISITLLVYFLICLAAVVVKDYVTKARGLNPDLLLICTIGGLIIPSVSHDYKLALLAGVMAICLSNRMVTSLRWKKMLSVFLITIASLAYSITLFPFKYKPEYLKNSFPPLLVILTSVTLLSFIDAPKYLGVDETKEVQE